MIQYKARQHSRLAGFQIWFQASKIWLPQCQQTIILDLLKEQKKHLPFRSPSEFLIGKISQIIFSKVNCEVAGRLCSLCFTTMVSVSTCKRVNSWNWTYQSCAPWLILDTLDSIFRNLDPCAVFRWKQYVLFLVIQQKVSNLTISNILMEKGPVVVHDLPYSSWFSIVNCIFQRIPRHPRKTKWLVFPVDLCLGGNPHFVAYHRFPNHGRKLVFGYPMLYSYGVTNLLIWCHLIYS